ncbi:MAG: DUF3488 and transglutaminase-like domain-containing protein [Gammaproteobacteria bacterium]|nr:DUF3488 and transglutaminase-like domain-containing protein [Gammaproteobacteria bacterium]
MMSIQGSVPLSRENLLWIFAAQLSVLLPHFTHLPLWVIGGWFAVVYWRLEIFRGRRKIPGKWLKLCIVVVTVVGLLLSYDQWFALESMVALLAVAFTLKNIELVSRRDVLLSMLLAYFLVAALFVFKQTIFFTLYGIACILLLIAALAAQQSLATARPWRAFSLSLRMLLQAAPVMLLFFLFVPRLGPLWAVPQHAAKAAIGISDTMSPGDFSGLTKSVKPALYIAFEGAAPLPHQRYWRGLVYTQFDGRRWHMTEGETDKINQSNMVKQRSLSKEEPHLRYRVTQEPSHSPWLFAMVQPTSTTLGVQDTRDGRLINARPVSSRFSYQVHTWLSGKFGGREALSDIERQQNLQLPAKGNPQARAWAQELVQAGSSAEEISQQLLQYYNRSFTYTLQPPLLGSNSVDEFLFASRSGFCEHFASSYVFIMRAAGVPARVVAGYQGGEWLEQQKYLLVRQYDAHAWAEIWTRQAGWQRVDPTAAVAPERILDGLQAAAAEEFLQGLSLSRRLPGLDSVLLEWQMLNYHWYQAVVRFDGKQRQQRLQYLLQKTSRLHFLWLLVAVFIALIFSLLLLRSRMKSGARLHLPAERLYYKFCRRLARVGIKRDVGESPRAFSWRVEQQFPRFGPLVMDVTAVYEQAAYAEDIAAEKQLRRMVRGFWPIIFSGGCR